MSDAILAVDVGSSSIRGAVFDTEGNRLQLVSRAYRDRGTRGSTGVFAAQEIARLLRDLLLELDLRSVGTVTFSSLWHSLVGVDESGAPTTPVYTWEAPSPDVTLDALGTTLELESYRRRTGSYLHASYPLAAWWYLRSEGVDADRWMDLPGWLAHETFGVAGGWSIDLAAGSGIWDQTKRRWDTVTAEAVRLDLSKLGEVWTEPQVVGDRGAELGLRGAVVIPPYGDGVCNSIGIGAVGPHVSALTAGTSGSFRVLLPGEAPATPFGLWRYQLADFGAVGGAVSNCGNVLQWVRESLDVADPLAFGGTRPPRFDGLAAVPHLSGQRGPRYRRGSAGALTGLRLQHDREDIARAFVFGILSTYRQLAGLLDDVLPQIDHFIAAGGVINARPVFAQLLADAVERPVYVAEADESSLLGAALRSQGKTAPAPGGMPLLPRPEWTESISIRTPSI